MYIAMWIFKGFYLRSRPFNNIHPQLRQIYDTSPNTQALECKTFISSSDNNQILCTTQVEGCR